MRRAMLMLAAVVAAALLWFAIVVFPRFGQQAAREALPPVLAGGPTVQDAARNIVTLEGRIARVDTAASGALRLTLRGDPDTSVIITASLDSAAARATPVPPPGTRVRLVGAGLAGAAPRLGVRRVLSLEVRE